jgi:hypothetical protein
MKFGFLRKLFNRNNHAPQPDPKMPDGSIAAIGDKMPDGTTYAGTPPLDDLANGVRAYVIPPSSPNVKR